MIDPQTKTEILKSNNPFVSSCTGNPWTNRFPDIGSINNKAYALISRLMDQKLRNTQDGMACLVLGEAGAGKTHLISRLLKQKIAGTSPFLFSYIQPIEDPQQTYRYLLKEIATNLCQPITPHKSATQMDAIFGLLLADLLDYKFKSNSISEETQQAYVRELRRNPLRYLRIKPLRLLLTNKHFDRVAGNYLINTFSGIDKDFVTAFLKLRLINQRAHAISWMKSAVLDEKDCELLGVKKRIEMSESALEQEARDILYSIGIILANYQRLLVVCFDRLENLDTREHGLSFGKMLEFLVDSSFAMFPIVFFRGQLWEERFSSELNQHVVSRLQSNKAVLTGCNAKEALEIIKARLEFAYQEDIDDDFFPFNKQVLDQIYQAEILSPREIIFEANHRLNDYLDNPVAEPVDGVDEVLMNLIKHEVSSLLKTFKELEPDRMRLRRSLRLYLSNIPHESGFQVKSAEFAKGNKEYIDCVCTISVGGKGDNKIAFIIDDSLHHRSVNARLKRGLAFLEDSVTHKVYYIREKRLKFPGPDVWKSTNDTLKTFKEKGGIDIRLTRNEAALWYALTFVSYKIGEGEVTCQNEAGGLETISKEQFSEFIATKLHDEKRPSLRAMDKAILKSRIDPLKRKRLEKLSVLNLRR